MLPLIPFPHYAKDGEIDLMHGDSVFKPYRISIPESTAPMEQEESTQISSNPDIQVHNLFQLINKEEESETSTDAIVNYIDRMDPEALKNSDLLNNNLLHRICDLKSEHRLSRLNKIAQKLIEKSRQFPNKIDLVNAQNDDGKTPLHLVCERTEESAKNTMQLLIDNGADPNKRDKESKTALHKVCANRHIPSPSLCERIDLLIKAGAILDFIDNTGKLPIHYALKSNKIKAVNLLIRKGAMLSQKFLDDTCHVNPAELSPLFFKRVAEAYLVQWEGELLFPENKPRTDSQTSRLILTEDNATLIRLIKEFVEGYSTENAINLIRQADRESLSKPDLEGNTPLHNVLLCLQPENGKCILAVVQELIEKKVDLDPQNHQGLTPLHIVCRSENTFSPKIAFLLIKAGAKHNIKDIHSDTPLHKAGFYNGSLIQVLKFKILEDNGADLDAENSLRITPRMLKVWDIQKCFQNSFLRKLENGNLAQKSIKKERKIFKRKLTDCSSLANGGNSALLSNKRQRKGQAQIKNLYN